jgi:hypothetical protein
MNSPTTSDPIIEACLFCNVKVRIQADKVLSARCPKCKGPIGDPKMEQACAGCKAVNRVLRSRLAAARCGKCKEPLLPPGPVPRELVLADLYAAVGAIFAHPMLAARRARPRDLVEAVGLLEAMPQAIAEIAANMAPGPERDQLAQLAGRCKALPAKVRPLAFEAAAVLKDQETVDRFMLAEAFEILRVHPAGFRFLAQVRRSDPGPTSAREELACARAPFERILDRVYKVAWGDDAPARQRRAEGAERIFGELSKVLEVWLPRPYKHEAMVKSAMTRLLELPDGGEAVAAQEAAIREDVAVFLAIGTAGVARGVAYHGLADDPKEAWWRIQSVLRGGLLDA